MDPENSERPRPPTGPVTWREISVIIVKCGVAAILLIVPAWAFARYVYPYFWP